MVRNEWTDDGRRKASFPMVRFPNSLLSARAKGAQRWSCSNLPVSAFPHHPTTPPLHHSAPASFSAPPPISLKANKGK